MLGADALAETLLAPQVEAWAAAGCALVVLAEPFLPREPQRIDELLAALERLPGHVPCALQLPFADAAPLLAPLADARVDAVGVDLHATTLEAVPEGYPKPVLAGVVDATGSLLEEPLALAGTVRALRERCPAGVALTPNGDLQHVPEPIAREKLRPRARAQNPAPIEDREAVRDLLHLAQDMAGKKHGPAQPLKTQKEIHDAPGAEGVQTYGRLVEKEQLRVAHEGLRQTQPPQHVLGELRRGTAGRGAQIHQFEQVLGARLRLVPRQPA